MIRRGPEGERGAILVLFTLLVTATMIFAAFAVDLTSQRVNHRTQQTTADQAAAAAAARLNWGDVQGACQNAFTYLRNNTPDLPQSTVDCSPLGTTATCDNTNPAPHEATFSPSTAPYTIRLRYPIPDAEIADSHFSTGADDGAPCQRLRVSIAKQATTYFSRVIGVQTLSAQGSTVVRQTGGSQVVPALWVLDPFACPAVNVQGGSQITVGSTLPTVIPGVITVDSDGSGCTGSQKTVTVGGTGSFLHGVPTSGQQQGVIDLYAMPPGQTTCTNSGAGQFACDPASVASGALSPQPGPLNQRVTRAPVDWRYNCKATYPAFHGIAETGCPDAGTRQAYVDALRAAVGTTSGGSVPAGFQRWTSSFSCNVPAIVPIVVTGNWYVDCPAGLKIGTGVTLTFASGNVILDGDLAMTGGTLIVNGVTNLNSTVGSACQTTVCAGASSVQAAYMFLRGAGNLNITGGTPVFNNVFVYANGGYTKVAGGTPPVWSAPAEGPFSGLSLWAELSSNKFQVNGGATMSLSGTFFAPEAVPFTFSGGAPTSQQHAQFISYDLSISGGALLSMAPDPTSEISIPSSLPLLIR